MKSDLDRQDDDIYKLREEINLYKGRCSNLQRDIELQGSAMNKLSNDSGGLGEQLNLYKDRISQLEDELSRTKEEKTDQVYEIRRLTGEKEKLEDKFKTLQSETIKNQGESQTSGATINRHQAQMSGTKNDLELMMK